MVGRLEAIRRRYLAVSSVDTRGNGRPNVIHPSRPAIVAFRSGLAQVTAWNCGGRSYPKNVFGVREGYY